MPQPNTILFKDPLKYSLPFQPQIYQSALWQQILRMYQKQETVIKVGKMQTDKMTTFSYIPIILVTRDLCLIFNNSCPRL